jgi:hypothetical protein
MNESSESHATNIDEILPEYDFCGAWPNKYASRYVKENVPGAAPKDKSPKRRRELREEQKS